MSTLRTFTFTLPTLFWATAVAAACCGVYVWMGLAGLIIYLAMGVGIFGGLAACALLDLGFTFTNVRVDVLKCLAVSAVVCGITYALIVNFGGLGAGVLPICWLIAVKLCWSELEKGELFLAFATSFFAPAIVVVFILQIAGTS